MASEKRLIDATELKDGVSSLTGMFTDEIDFAVSLDAVIRKIEAAPTVDAVEVVRCKDCKLRHSSEFCECRPSDGFCGDGERKDNEN